MSTSKNETWSHRFRRRVIAAKFNDHETFWSARGFVFGAGDYLRAGRVRRRFMVVVTISEALIPAIFVLLTLVVTIYTVQGLLKVDHFTLRSGTLTGLFFIFLIILFLFFLYVLMDNVAVIRWMARSRHRSQPKKVLHK